MNHLSYLTHTVIFILLVGCARQDKNTAANTGQLNVLFIIADDLNCDLGAYGNYIPKEILKSILKTSIYWLFY